jgi:hypothetical protein
MAPVRPSQPAPRAGVLFDPGGCRERPSSGCEETGNQQGISTATQNEGPVAALASLAIDVPCFSPRLSSMTNHDRTEPRAGGRQGAEIPAKPRPLPYRPEGVTDHPDVRFPQARGPKADREEGAALILTIIVLTILIVLVVQFAFSVNRETLIVRNTQDDAAMELAARGLRRTGPRPRGRSRAPRAPWPRRPGCCGRSASPD